MRPRTLATILLALALGVALGVASTAGVSAWRQAAALRRIVHADPGVRDAGWAWLLRPDRTGLLARLDALGPRIDERLAAAPDDALVHGAVALGGRGRFGWTTRDRVLVARAMPLLAADGRTFAPTLALELLEGAPPRLELATLRATATPLVAGSDDDLRRRAFTAALGAAGRERAGLALDLVPPPDDIALRRRRRLALSWAPSPVDPEPVPANAPPALVGAELMRHVAQRPDDAGPVLDRLDDPDAAALPLDDLLGRSRDPAALRALGDRAESGRRSARLALHARRATLDRTQARQAALDADRSRDARRIAAWRWGDPPVTLARELLAGPPADADGRVAASVLFAERLLPADEAAALAETWIRSFDDDAKRAGAILAALLGVHDELLAEAAELEDVLLVRTTQLLALRAFETSVGPATRADRLPAETFLFRAGTSGPDLDLALVLLAGGMSEALSAACTVPRAETAEWGPPIRTRAWLVERFVPAWHEDAGRPVGSSVAALELYLDRLDARRQLDARRLRFDRATRTYAVAPSSAGVADAPAPE